MSRKWLSAWLFAFLLMLALAGCASAGSAEGWLYAENPNGTVTVLGVEDASAQALTLPLTHPHTYLAATTNAPQKQKEAAVSPGRFLAAAAAALSHPFYPLFMRSPVAAPYAALLLLP